MLRTMLLPFFPRLIPGPEVMVGQVKSQFDDNGVLVNERGAELLAGLMDEVRHAALQAKS